MKVFNNFLNYIKKYHVQYLSIFIATLSNASDALLEGWVSPAVHTIMLHGSSIPITPEQCKWISQAQILGKIAATFVLFVLLRNRSRKSALRIATVPILISWLANLYAPTTMIFLLGKFIGGIGSSAISIIIYMYIGEITSPQIRGVANLLVKIMWTLSILIMFIIAPRFPLHVSSTIGLCFTLFQMLLNFLIPESPYYLLTQNREEEAEANLKRLNPNRDIKRDIERMKSMVEQQSDSKDQFFTLFANSVYRKPLLIVLATLIIQQSAGVTVMGLNVHHIFYLAGGSEFSELSSVIYQSLMVAACIVSVFIVERFKRKNLMVFSSFVTSAMLAFQGAFFYIKDMPFVNFQLISYLLIADLVIYVISFRIGLGIVPNVLVSEIFSMNVKIAGCACSNFVLTVTILLSIFLFHFTQENFGTYVPFWIFSCVCFLGGIFSLYFIPNTKGKTLEEIQFMLAKKSTTNTKNNDIEI